MGKEHCMTRLRVSMPQSVMPAADTALCEVEAVRRLTCQDVPGTLACLFCSASHARTRLRR